MGAGSQGDGNAIALGALVHGGLLWFLSAENPEMLIRVIDGCAINQKY